MRKIVALVVVVLFVTGSFVAAMAADKTACDDKNVLQCAYNWFSGMGKTCEKSSTCCCKACNTQCCKTCDSDCGGKCCSGCVKK